MTSPATTAAAPGALPLPVVGPAARGLILAGALLVGLLVVTAGTRHFTIGSPTTSLSPIWLPLHLATAIPSIPLGAWVLLRRKGDRLHRLLGRIWAVLMLGAALTSFGLAGIFGHVGPIHILSLAVLVGIPRAVLAVRAGRIRSHVRGMTIMYGSVVLAALFAFLPGRMLGLWLFG
ncbi:DUF2306 domain-containing protein [Sphingomonas sp.]|uniref:DUF2306 domain-containing protein n=1 Tax=Sphingomonas sp. TaxID=28214 RepID=UPI0025D482A1|nr:DUF2306 domain-containing protein [Sphingomonas sp.]